MQAQVGLIPLFFCAIRGAPLLALCAFHFEAVFATSPPPILTFDGLPILAPSTRIEQESMTPTMPPPTSHSTVSFPPPSMSPLRFKGKLFFFVDPVRRMAW